MATRWMKWNEGTHIFEYSTDGVVFSPLPLDASILTQGLIDPARLPAGLPGGGSNNVWTGSNIYSGVEPRLRFNETDQVAGLKNWDIGINAGVYGLRTLDDAFAVVAEPFKINRNGQVIITPTVSGDAVFIQGAINNFVNLSLRNTDAGANRITKIQLGNDASVSLGVIAAFSSGYTSGAWNIADALLIEATRIGGLNLTASHASGAIKLYSGGSAIPRLTIASSGDASFSGSIIERARAVAMGDWTAYTPVWASGGAAPVIGNGVLAGKYAKIGKTVLVQVKLVFGSTTTAGGAPPWTFSLPPGSNAMDTGASGYGSGAARIFDAGVAHSVAMIYFTGTTSFSLLSQGHTGGGLGPGLPIAWAASDAIIISFFYDEA